MTFEFDRGGRIAGWICVVACLCGGEARAFEADEHRRLGDASLFVGLAYVLSRSNTATPPSSVIDANLVTLLHERHRSAFEPAPPEGFPTMLTYGGIASCVDQMGGGAEAALRTLLPGVPVPGAPSRAEALSRQLGSTCANPVLALFAARTNASHFGDEGMAAFAFTHDAALDAARRKGDLYDALVTNAVADHYLVDHFAPGHVVGDRRALTDSSAVAMHDAANRSGGRYRVVLEASVRELADHLCNSDKASTVRAALVPRGRSEAELEEDGRGATSRASAAKWPNSRDGSVFRSGAHLRRSCQWILNSDERVVLFRGDDYLFRDSADDQRLLMLLTQAASVVQVLEAGNVAGVAPSTSTPFRDFRRDPDCVGACADDRIRASVHALGGIGLRGGHLAFGEIAAPGPDRGTEHPPVFADTPYVRGDRAIMLGLSGEFSTHAGKSQFGRTVGVGEVWFPVPATDNFWAVVGAAISEEKEHTFNYWGTGPEVRLAYGLTTFPGTTVSLYYRNIKYGTAGDAGHLRVEHYGVRFDHGLSDLFGMYVAVHDTVRSYERIAYASDEWGLSFGLTIKVPGLRALRWFDD